MTQRRASAIPRIIFPENAETGLARTLVHIQEESTGWLFLGPIRGRSLEVSSPGSPCLACLLGGQPAKARLQVSARSSGKAWGFFARIQRTGQSDHSKANKETSTSFIALLSHSGPGVGWEGKCDHEWPYNPWSKWSH